MPSHSRISYTYAYGLDTSSSSRPRKFLGLDAEEWGALALLSIIVSYAVLIVITLIFGKVTIWGFVCTPFAAILGMFAYRHANRWIARIHRARIERKERRAKKKEPILETV